MFVKQKGRSVSTGRSFIGWGVLLVITLALTACGVSANDTLIVPPPERPTLLYFYTDG